MGQNIHAFSPSGPPGGAEGGWVPGGGVQREGFRSVPEPEALLQQVLAGVREAFSQRRSERRLAAPKRKR